MLQRFLLHFSPRRYFQTRTEVKAPSRGFGRREWVLARSLCLYKLFVMGEVPLSERANALNMRIHQWSPFRETGRYVVWHGTSAMVWIWDESLRRESAPEENAALHMIPETLLYPRPDPSFEGEETLRFISCLEGMEAQVWAATILTASRWWDRMPSPEEWAHFLLAQDLDPSQEPPQPQPLPWLERPWAKSAQRSLFSTLQQEKRCAALAGIAFLLLFVWQGVGIWRLKQATRDLQEKVTHRTREVEPLLSARNQAMNYRQLAEKLAGLSPLPSQMEIMAAAAEKISGEGTVLTEWHYSKGHLNFVLRGKDLDPRYYVKAYEDYPCFKDVLAERGATSDRLEVKMNVVAPGNR